MQIKGTVALVTGGASGIGEAVCLELARREVRAVIVVDRSDRALEVARSVNAAVGRPVAEGQIGDATDETFRAGVFDQVTARHGVVQICVPAAGITRDSLAVKVDKGSGKA